jgi:hypothetical protein
MVTSGQRLLPVAGRGGNYLGIDGNVIPRNHPQFQELTHIMYEGIP